jgi:hypothetical protein
MATTYHNAALNISQSTTNSMIYSASGDFLTAGSGETLILKNIQISNTTPAVSGVFYDQNVNVYLIDSSTSTTHSLATFIDLPKFSSIDILSDNLVLESGDKIQIYITGSSEGTITYKADAVGSYLKVT